MEDPVLQIKIWALVHQSKPIKGLIEKVEKHKGKYYPIKLSISEEECIEFDGEYLTDKEACAIKYRKRKPLKVLNSILKDLPTHISIYSKIWIAKQAKKMGKSQQEFLELAEKAYSEKYKADKDLQDYRYPHCENFSTLEGAIQSMDKSEFPSGSEATEEIPTNAPTKTSIKPELQVDKKDNGNQNSSGQKEDNNEENLQDNQQNKENIVKLNSDNDHEGYRGQDDPQSNEEDNGNQDFSTQIKNNNEQNLQTHKQNEANIGNKQSEENIKNQQSAEDIVNSNFDNNNSQENDGSQNSSAQSLQTYQNNKESNTQYTGFFDMAWNTAKPVFDMGSRYSQVLVVIYSEAISNIPQRYAQAQGQYNAAQEDLRNEQVAYNQVERKFNIIKNIKKFGVAGMISAAGYKIYNAYSNLDGSFVDKTQQLYENSNPAKREIILSSFVMPLFDNVNLNKVWNLNTGTLLQSVSLGSRAINIMSNSDSFDWVQKDLKSAVDSSYKFVKEEPVCFIVYAGVSGFVGWKSGDFLTTVASGDITYKACNFIQDYVDMIPYSEYVESSSYIGYVLLSQQRIDDLTNSSVFNNYLSPTYDFVTQKFGTAATDGLFSIALRKIVGFGQQKAQAAFEVVRVNDEVGGHLLFQDANPERAQKLAEKKLNIMKYIGTKLDVMNVGAAGYKIYSAYNDDSLEGSILNKTTQLWNQNPVEFSIIVTNFMIPLLEGGLSKGTLWGAAVSGSYAINVISGQGYFDWTKKDLKTVVNSCYQFVKENPGCSMISAGMADVAWMVSDGKAAIITARLTYMSCDFMQSYTNITIIPSSYVESFIPQQDIEDFTNSAVFNNYISPTYDFGREHSTTTAMVTTLLLSGQWEYAANIALVSGLYNYGHEYILETSIVKPYTDQYIDPYIINPTKNFVNAGWDAMDSLASDPIEFVMEDYPLSSIVVTGGAGIAGLWGASIVLTSLLIAIGAGVYNYNVGHMNAETEEAIAEKCYSNEVIDALGGTEEIDRLQTLSANQSGSFDKFVLENNINMALDNAWNNYFVSRDGYKITTDNVNSASDMRICVDAIKQQYDYSINTLWEYAGNYWSYGKLFPTYQDCKDAGNSNKRCFYSYLKIDAGDMGLKGTDIGQYVKQWEYLTENGVSEDISVTDIINIKDILNDFAQINDLRLADLIVNNQEQFKNLFENTEFYDSKSGNELIELLDVVIKKRLINAVNGFQSDYEIAHNCQCTVVNVCAVDRKYTTNYSDLDKSDQVRGGIDYPESCYDNLDFDPEILAVKTVCDVGGNESVIFKDFNQYEVGLQFLQPSEVIGCDNYL